MSGTGDNIMFLPDNVKSMIMSEIEDDYVRDCLLDALRQCHTEDPNQSEWMVMGPLAGVTNIRMLACVDNRFTRVSSQMSTSNKC